MSYVFLKVLEPFLKIGISCFVKITKYMLMKENQRNERITFVSELCIIIHIIERDYDGCDMTVTGVSCDLIRSRTVHIER